MGVCQNRWSTKRQHTCCAVFNKHSPILKNLCTITVTTYLVKCLSGETPNIYPSCYTSSPQTSFEMYMWQSCVTCVSPTHNESSVIQCFKHGNVLNIHDNNLLISTQDCHISLLKAIHTTEGCFGTENNPNNKHMTVMAVPGESNIVYCIPTIKVLNLHISTTFIRSFALQQLEHN